MRSERTHEDVEVSRKARLWCVRPPCEELPMAGFARTGAGTRVRWKSVRADGRFSAARPMWLRPTGAGTHSRTARTPGASAAGRSSMITDLDRGAGRTRTGGHRRGRSRRFIAQSQRRSAARPDACPARPDEGRWPCWPTRASSCSESAIGSPRASSGMTAATRSA